MVERARSQDAAKIVAVLRSNLGERFLFQRSARDVRKHFRDFVVARDASGEVVGCAALHRYSAVSGEVLSVAVMPAAAGQGIGRTLVDECERIAREEGLAILWLATAKPEYFSRFGYRQFSRWELPASVLLRKLGQVFAQPIDRWSAALLGKHVYMRLRLDR